VTVDFQLNGFSTFNSPGSYTILVIARDAKLNTAEAKWSITITAAEKPIIILNGDKDMQHEAGTPFTDPLATIEDTLEDDLTRLLQVSGGVNVNRLDIYTITYAMSVPDKQGQKADPVNRTVEVKDTIAPVGS
jgi:hypothetical protein